MNGLRGCSVFTLCAAFLLTMTACAGGRAKIRFDKLAYPVSTSPYVKIGKTEILRDEKILNLRERRHAWDFCVLPIRHRITRKISIGWPIHCLKRSIRLCSRASSTKHLNGIYVFDADRQNQYNILCFF